MQSNSHMFHINHNLLLHQFYNDVSSPSYRKKKQSKLKKQTNKKLGIHNEHRVFYCIMFRFPQA